MESTHHLLGDTGEEQAIKSRDPLYTQCALFRRGRLIYWLSIINILCCITTLLVVTSYRFHQTQRATSLAGQFSSTFDPSQQTIRQVDGRLFSITNSSASKYVGAPSSEVDAAWDMLSAEGKEVALIDSKGLESAGYNASQYIKAPEEWGIRNELYPVQIDAFHQIHCLDQLRKQMHARHYYPDQQEHFGDQHWDHINHCLHILLQNIVCQANVEPIPHRWVENLDMPYAQFGIKKECRNFDALQEWNEKNSLRDINAKWAGLQRPVDAFVWEGFGEEVGKERIDYVLN